LTDIFDQATKTEEFVREQDIARQRREAEERKRARQAGAAVLRRDCADCGDGIPLNRRDAMPACTRCIKCEQAAELRDKLMKR